MSYSALNGTAWMQAFSEYGRESFLPQGIFYWAGRAKAEADINATIGTAWARLREFTDQDSDKLSVAYLPTLYKIIKEEGLTPGEIFPYAPMEGLPAFRKVWKQHLLSKAGDQAERLGDKITLPMVTPGITGALYLMMKLFLSPGEKILFSDRRWGNYNNLIKINTDIGIKTFEFFSGNEFNIDGFIQGVRDCLRDQGKAVAAINFPNNPTGFSPGKDTQAPLIKKLVEAADEGLGPVVVLIDDAYEGFVYEPSALDRSIFYGLAGIHKNLIAVKLDAVSKEFFWYGGRTGAVTMFLPDEEGKSRADLDEHLMNKLSALIRSTVSNCPIMVQNAMIKAFDRIDRLQEERETIRLILQRRWRMLMDEAGKLGDWGGNRLLPCNSGFFSFVDVAKTPADKLADHLLKKYKTGVVAQTGAAGNGIRLGFCGVPGDQIPVLVQNVHSALADLT